MSLDNSPNSLTLAYTSGYSLFGRFGIFADGSTRRFSSRRRFKLFFWNFRASFIALASNRFDNSMIPCFDPASKTACSAGVDS
jgi:hypothetical protein